MITLLGSLLGFFSAAFPDMLKLFRDAQDRKHELKILEMQMEQQRQGHSQRLEEIGIQADIAESQALYKTYNTGIRWVDALGVGDYDIHVECRNISGRSLWVGNFSTQEKKFKVFAEAN